MATQARLVRNNDMPPVQLYTSPAQFREEARRGLVVLTRNQCPGYVQCGLVALPRAQALDFMIFCQRNQKACPMIEVLDAGEVEPRRSAPGADVRTDLPLYSATACASKTSPT